jgi:sarcosine oxidase, subunit alpha
VSIMRSSGDASIDRSRPLAFTFNGRRYVGYAGDTLASALLANGVRIVGRSFKLHRPRGIFSAGLEEPNGVLTIGEGGFREVNVRATEIALYDGLAARSQNCWPSVGFDAASLLGWGARLLPAGFYHKTFKWPAWRLFEPIVRRMAGLGRLGAQADPDRYATRFHHCDVLVIGGGFAGLTAALSAAVRGRDVVLLDGDTAFGGALLSEGADIDGMAPRRWVVEQLREIAATGRVRLLPRTVAFGYYDGNLVAAIERLEGPAGKSTQPGPVLRQRLWKIRATHVVLATGAIERPLVFANNDRPGIMLASAVRTYARRYAVCPGSRAVVFTNNDSAYDAAFALRERGVEIAAIIDVRGNPNGEATLRARRDGIPLYLGSAVVDTRGRRAIHSIGIAKYSADFTQVLPHTLQSLRCDLLCVSGGWNPNIHLYSQAGGTLRYDEQSACFVPDRCEAMMECVGAAAGQFDLISRSSPAPIQPVWCVPAGSRQDRRHHQWVDFAHDVTVCDIELAATEGFRSVEHLKRYTTVGMALDQGKTSNVNALALLAQSTGRAIGDVGTTTFRPPFHSMTIGALAGIRKGALAHRFRRLPVTSHEKCGAVLEEHSGWLRPAYYLRAAESEGEAIDREVHAARATGALFDASSLGKIEVRGPDAAEFLNRLYVNNVKTLAPGSLRYGLMLNDNGIVIDDGVFGCVAPDHYFVNTSSAGALNIHFWMEEWLQCEWRALRVWIAQQSAQWATLTLSGPMARAVLRDLGPGIDLDARSFRHMQMRESTFEGAALRVRRASFTGETSFELDVPADRGDALWNRLLHLGAARGIMPIGMEALDILRIEKGFLEVGVDTDGDTSPLDIGWGSAIAKKPGDFLGRRSLRREAMQAADRLQLVGLLPDDAGLDVPVGTHAVDVAGNVDGHVTSSCRSPHLKRSVAMAMVRSGFERKGQTVTLRIDDRAYGASIVDTAFYDPKGERLHG